MIACENTLPGDPQSDWKITGSGDPTLQGFATAMSVNAGQTISFKISSTVSAYRIDILRLGYYQGNGARKVAAAIAPTASFPQPQPSCLTQSATGLVDCGNWAISASWNVPTDVVSGYYIAHLFRNDTGSGSTIPFVVRSDGSHADFVYEADDETMEAYNTYGGNSLYQCSVACPVGNPQGYKAAYAVSYNRPFHTADDDQGRSWVYYTELPMIEFMEQNGYDVTYVAATDVDAGTANLANHKIFVSNGHDEYWSGNQRNAVTAARDAGVSLAFFSGNEVFWKTRFGPSSDGSNTAQRTLICYKETHFSAPTDPADPPTWTGTWTDPRFSPPADGGNPPNALTGQQFVVNSGSGDIKVPAAYSGLRFWRNTAVASLSAGQTLTLDPGGNTLGYEWDEDADNGFRPPGTIDMSSTTLPSTEAFPDYGTTTQTGVSSTHNLTLYRAASGAIVFGAGTVQWAWGLEPGSASGTGSDRNMQQATVNLFADMGAQPATLMSGLIPAAASTDATAPTSVISSPAPGANLSDGSTVTISGTAVDAGGGVIAGVEVSTDGGTTWHRANGTTSWTYSWLIHGNPTAKIESRAADDSGNIESPSAGVTVGVPCPCTIFGTSTAPSVANAGDPNAIEVGVKFTSDTFGTINGIRFYKSTTNTGTHQGSLWSSTGQLLATATFAGESASGWQSVSFSKPVPILPNTTYVASYFAPNGHYSGDDNYFYGSPQVPTQQKPSIMDSPPLHVLRQTSTNGNGVYRYGSTSAFPSTTDVADNYWVDVSFIPQPAPTTPTNVVAVGGYSSASVTWTAGSGGGPATAYIVTPFVGGVAKTSTTVTGSPAPTAATITGLANGTTYTFAVTASNPVGSSAASAMSNGATPSATASVVLNGTFEAGISAWAATGTPSPSATTAKAHGGTSSALVAAVQPASIPAGDSSLSQTLTVPTGSSALSFWYWPQTVDDLCSGSGCKFDWQEAQIRNTSGATLASIFKSNSNAQTWTQVTFDTTAYAGQTVVVWFNVHNDGSQPPDDTNMYLDDVALNATGGGPTAPGAPTSVSAAAGNAAATVSWTAPANGGSAITSYTVTPFAGGSALTPTVVNGSPPATTATVGGLTNGTSYTFTVAATNGVGTGPASAASAAVTPTATSLPVFVQQASAHGSATSLTTTPAAAVTVGNRLVVLVGVWASTAPTARTVTDSAGNSYVELLHFTAADKTELSVWSAPITKGGGTRPTVTATATASADIGLSVLEYSGLSQVADSTVLDRSAQATGTTGSTAVTVNSGATAATTGPGELALGLYIDSGFSDTLTAASGYTARTNVSPVPDMEMLAEDQTVPTGATPNAGVGTGKNTEWLLTTIVLKTSAASGG